MPDSIRLPTGHTIGIDRQWRTFHVEGPPPPTEPDERGKMEAVLLLIGKLAFEANMPTPLIQQVVDKLFQDGPQEHLPKVQKEEEAEDSNSEEEEESKPECVDCENEVDEEGDRCEDCAEKLRLREGDEDHYAEGSGKECPDCGEEIGTDYNKCTPCWDKHPHRRSAKSCLARDEAITAQCEHPSNDETVSESDNSEGAEMSNAGLTKEDLELKAKFKDIGIIRTGDKIILPENMPTKIAYAWLGDMLEQENRVISINETFDCHPYEGALALQRALLKKYGWTANVSTPGFFGEDPPALITVPISKDETVVVPWGGMKVPGLTGVIYTQISVKDNRPVFCITGRIKQGEKYVVEVLSKLIREELAANSIYRGKAFVFPYVDPDNLGNTSLEDFLPKFIDFSGVDPSKLIFSKAIEEEINAAIFTPIRKMKLLRRFNVPRKRCTLLGGPPGTGKSLTASAAAKYCVENGVTFIAVEDPKTLKAALEFAAQYQPAMVFCEDIDRVMHGENRTQEMDDVLNTVDGVDKSKELMVVLTTNKVEHITKAMIRPGRVDAAIQVAAPDAEAITRLIRSYVKDTTGLALMNENEDLMEVGKTLNGIIPAAVREVVEYAKLCAIANLPDDVNVDNVLINLSANDLLVSARTKAAHLKLLEDAPVDMRDGQTKIADSITEIARALDTTTSPPKSSSRKGLLGVPADAE